jgi:hypothetical protein
MNSANPEAAIEKEQNSLQGYVVMLPYGGGSKSAGMRPVLLREDKKIVRICFHTDNPFSNATLWPFHLKYCRLDGHWDGTDLIVESVEESPDPALEFPTQQ